MPQSILHFLPAQHGDAFIIHCFKGEHEGYLVIDGGPRCLKSADFITKQIEQLPSVDLMILTHHDDDHIGGLLHYIKKHQNDDAFPVHLIWANCARYKDFQTDTNLSPNQASKLADLLIQIEKKASKQWKDYIYAGSYYSIVPFANFEFISPVKNILDQYIVEYHKKLSEQVSCGADLVTQHTDDISVDLETLSTRSKKYPNLNNYKQLANAVSMAFIMECDNLKVLMLGDSFPQFIIPYLRQILEQKGRKKLKVDYVKVSHHGSKNNISNELLDLIDCDNYIISTNGGCSNSKHPDRETMANILCHSDRNRDETIHFYFNYSLNFIQKRTGELLFNEGEDEQYNYVIHEPDDLIIDNEYRIDRY